MLCYQQGVFLLRVVSRYRAVQAALTIHLYSYYTERLSRFCEPVCAPWAIARAQANAGETRRDRQERPGEGRGHVETEHGHADTTAAWSASLP